MNFKSDFNKFKKKTDRKVTAVFRGASLLLFSSVIKMSPVGNTDIWKNKYPKSGYVGGRFRANWQTSLRSPKNGEVESTSPTTSIISATKSTRTAGMSDALWFVNNVPYANRLENGWSTQAPSGMVKRSAKKWRSIVESVAKKEAKKK